MKPSKLHPVMLVGTGSDVGQSVLNAALCRIFQQDGYHPAPFKAQNMALNSYVTPNGLEIGRAQAVQAEAARIACETDMNPLLLKPNSEHTTQVVLNGKPIGNRSAYDYFRKEGREELRQAVCAAFDRLAAKYNPIVMEGAGSVSELNLRDIDLVNMPMAQYADADVILVADIDRGGCGCRCKAIIGIFECHGDIDLLAVARVSVGHCAGNSMIPYYNNIYIDEEDSVALEQKHRQLAEGKINVAVVLLRHISNYTDFDTLERDPRVNLFYTNNISDIQQADIVILPGTKATLDDLMELRRNGCAQAIQHAHREGKTVIGICGGYQMLGQTVNDPDGIEGSVTSLPGLGLLPIHTTMTAEKTTKQVTFMFEGQECQGYEIHQGVSDTEEPILQTDHCIGTYIHGFLDNAAVINYLLKSNVSSQEPNVSLAEFKDHQYNLLADHVRKHMDISLLYQIMGGPKS